MIRIGILGAARIAPKAVIYPASVRGDVVIKAVAARDIARAKAFAEKYSEPRGEIEALETYQAVIDHPDIDLIYNPLPINLHAEWTIKALEAGKHVLCEKPFAMNIAEAEAMLAAASANDKRLIEAFHYRYHPAFIDMLEIIDTGALGKLSSLTAVFNVPIPDLDGTEIRHLPETGGGAFMDLGCYPLSWALMALGGQPSSVEATATLTKRGVDESLNAQLTFPGGVHAELSASMASDTSFAASLNIHGENGHIEFLNPLAPHMGAHLSVTIGDETKTSVIDQTTTYAFQMNAVAAALKSGEPLPTEGEAILRQQRTLDAVYEAAGLRHLRYR